MFAIVPAEMDALHFAQRVSRENMEKYHTALGRHWDPALLQSTWSATENYSILAGGDPIGVLRLRIDPDALYVSDLQIAANSQGRGAGSFALQFVERVARERGFPRIRLRAFAGSPAVRLYLRAGFVKVADEPGKLLFERAL